MPGGGATKSLSGALPAGRLYDAEREVYVGGYGTAAPERLLVMDPNGRKIHVEMGGDDYVNISPSLLPKLKGNIVTHNHPSGNGFSSADWYVGAKAKAKEIRVITDERIYSITGFDRGLNAIKVKLAADRFADEVRNEQIKEMVAGKLTSAQAERRHWDLVAKRMAKTFGVEYKVMSRA
jgi:hypothetical protein